jgi:hypothetical protein
MTDENKLIDEVLYGLKVPPKQTSQNKRSMKRSEKNINRNLYDDVLKPLTNKSFKEGGALKAGMLGALAGSMQGKSKVKVEKPKGTKGKGSADTLTGKLVRTYSVKEKKQMKERAKDSLKASGLGSGLTSDKEYETYKKSVTKKLTGGQAKIDKNKNNKIDAEDFKILREGAFSGKMMSKLSQDVISRAFPKTVGQKEREEQMYMEQKAKYDKPQKLSQGGGIAIKGTKFKGVF